MKKIIFTALAALFSLGFFQVNAQVNSEYKKALQTYMVNSGTMNSLGQVLDPMMAMMGGQLTEAQKEEITSRSIDALVELMVPVYESEISLDDLKEYNKFFETPAGRRISAAQPKMVTASMQASQQWAAKLQQIIQEVMTR